MRRITRIILVVSLLLALLAPSALANQDAIRGSVVRVFGTESTVNAITGETQSNMFMGTGFALGKQGQPVKFFATNKHVVDGASELYITYEYSNDLIPVKVAAISDRADLAVLALDTPTTNRKPAVLRPFSTEEQKSLTESVWAYGFPAITNELIDINHTGDYLSGNTAAMTVTGGIISRTVEHMTSGKGELIYHDAVLAGGNSGGPLVDKNGYVLGVDASGIMQGENDTFSVTSFSVSSNELIRLLDNEKIPYTTVADVRNRKILIAALIMLAVIALAVVLALLLRRKPSMKRTLVCETGALAGKSFPVQSKTVIGRERGRCQIVFPDSAGGVSGVHCTVFIQKGRVMVRDENSSYGTWVDQNKLKPGATVEIHRGQRLYLGSQNQSLTLRS